MATPLGGLIHIHAASQAPAPDTSARTSWLPAKGASSCCLACVAECAYQGILGVLQEYPGTLEMLEVHSPNHLVLPAWHGWVFGFQQRLVLAQSYGIVCTSSSSAGVAQDIKYWRMVASLCQSRSLVQCGEWPYSTLQSCHARGKNTSSPYVDLSNLVMSSSNFNT